MASSSAAEPKLTRALASAFTRIALGHVSRQYPNKLDHVLTEDDDAQTPRALHPIFFGSFDWHSCVHGFWTLARLLRRFPDRSECAQVRALFDERFTGENVSVECAYLRRPAARGFERPYGWAWLLMLWAELALLDDSAWALALRPLALAFAERFKAFLPLASYPIRAGTHGNTAFAAALVLDYCAVAGDEALRAAIVERLRHWYARDRACQAWEPSQDDFLSPALIEAEAMRRALGGGEFADWLGGFLPDLARGEPKSLFTPAFVSDRGDGKIAHLDGLNLSRAWCWRGIALTMPDPISSIAKMTAAAHLTSALSAVEGDYMGEHWLASFALLALEATEG